MISKQKTKSVDKNNENNQMLQNQYFKKQNPKSKKQMTLGDLKQQNNLENFQIKQSKKQKKQSKKQNQIVNLSEDDNNDNYYSDDNTDSKKLILDYFDMELKENYKSRPLFISPDKSIFLEADHKLYRIAYEFIFSIADPIYRPTLFHYYKLTKYSLYTAMVLQYNPKDILDLLEKLSKNQKIPEKIKNFILENTVNYGSSRMFLRDSFYYLDIVDSVYNKYLQNIESLYNILEEVIIDEPEQILKENEELVIIQEDISKIVKLNNQMEEEEENENEEIEDNQNNNIRKIQVDDFKIESDSESENSNNNDFQNQSKIHVNTIHNKNKNFLRFKINGDHFKVTEQIIKNNIPLIQEYDFNKNQEEDVKNNLILDITLKPKMKTRFYQERALKNIFINNKARSGLVILPCGAGKTVVGIISLVRIKRNSIIICDSDVSVDQWRDELERWSTIKRQNIVRLTGKIKDKWEDTNQPVVVITTYFMLIGKKDCKENEVISKMKQVKEWNTCIIDEVHKLPAQTFQNVLKQYKFHFKLGLTATPYREDDKINNLFYMIGPKLYEENWLDLVNQGFLAKPYCIELRCKMSPIFAQEYQDKKGHQRELIHTSNPVKFQALQYLIKVHEERGDKILVFCDRPKVIEEYCQKLKYPCIHGKISQDERRKIFTYFKTGNQINTIFLSRVGDTAIDLPSANVGIQIGVHFGSRRQEVQRLGRIMRAKENSGGGYNAFWYTLISQNTDETTYCWGRQKCLIDQGFKYEIVNEESLPYNQEPEKFKWIKQLDEKEYLFDILLSQENQNEDNLQKKNHYKKVSSDSNSEDSDNEEESQELFKITKTKGLKELEENNVQPYLEIGKKDQFQF